MSNYSGKNILVPVDFSQNSWNALCYAVTLYKKIKCNFYILHVAEIKDQPINTARLFQIPTNLKDSKTFDKKELLNAFIDKVNHHFQSKHHHFFGKMEYGNLVDALKKQLTEKHIDLITMGTTGISSLKKKIMGSNTGATLTRVRCNTLVVPEMAGFEKLKNITFPTDFNIFYSPKILKSIQGITKLIQGKLNVVHVSSKHSHFTDTQIANKDYLLEYLEEISPGKYGFKMIYEKKIIHAIQGFIKESDTDMIVLIARNLNFLQQLFFDSKVERLSFHSTIPMFVIHE